MRSTALALARCVLLAPIDVVNLRELAGTLDLWLCMWEPAEQE